MTDTVELLPCPFCGCSELHSFEHSENDVSFGFQCMNCWMTGPQFITKEEAVTAWNNRPATVPKSVADGLAEAALLLHEAESHYRMMHDYNGGGNIKTGRAWDRMRRAGDNARNAITEYRKATQ